MTVRDIYIFIFGACAGGTLVLLLFFIALVNEKINAMFPANDWQVHP